MIHQLITMPRDKPFFIACSGGIDSMTCASFYKRGGRSFTLAHFNHQTPQADQFQEFVSAWAAKNGIPFVSSKLTAERPKGTSREEFWRNERYAWFKTLGDPVATCHHLGDVSESWIFGACHGQPRLIMAKRDNIVRPFLTTTKESIVAWAKQHDVKWIEDRSNDDIRFARCNIRHNLIPRCLGINPGLLTMLAKKVIAAYKDTDQQ